MGSTLSVLVGPSVRFLCKRQWVSLRHRLYNTILLNKYCSLTMSLPVIKSFADCTDFSKTVVPFIPQLYDLPQRIFDAISDPNALKYIYLSTNPLVSASAFCLFTVPIFIIAAEVNRNYSQVDRFWSLLPTFYNVHFTLYAHAKGLPTQRLDLLALISILWSVRLFS